MADLSSIFVAVDSDSGSATLRCVDHQEWWADADVADVPTVVSRATAHFRHDHRVHVPWCMCRDPRVIDSRCVPAIQWGAHHA
jgi:hypothetical protein